MGIRVRRLVRLPSITLALLLAAGLLTVAAAARPAPAQAAGEYYPVPGNRVYTIDGHGYGHGHGMSQYGSQGAATQGLSAAQIVAFYYPGTTPTPIGTPTVRVQLTAATSADIRVESTVGAGAMSIRDQSSGLAVTAPPGNYRVLTANSQQRLLRYDGSAWVAYSIGGSGVYAGPLAFSSGDGASVWTTGTSARNYRGTISVTRTAAGTSSAVNTVNMQEYLLGVVPRESPAWFAPAALEAQAIAARSYAWWDVQTPSSSGWDICDTTACQVYGGRAVYTPSGGWQTIEYASTNAAVGATAGVALYYAGAPAFTQFSSSNGGVAAAGSKPYLAAFTDPYDGIPPQNKNHNWSDTLSASYLEATYPAIGQLQGIRVASRTGLGEWGGHLTGLQLVGSAGTVTVSSPRFTLKSTWWRPRPEGNPFGSLDAVTAVSGTQIRVQGWALDPDTTAPIEVHVYVDGRGQGAFAASGERPDVAAALPGRGSAHGYDFTLTTSQGSHTVCMYAINVGPGSTNPQLGCLDVTTAGLPLGNVEAASVSGGSARLVGWSLDPDSSAALEIHAYVNGVGSGAFLADGNRPDVGAAFPGSGNAHGFDISVALSPGANTVCLYAINEPRPAVNPLLGCRSLTLEVTPRGNLEGAVGTSSAIELVGWAFDPESSNPIDVHAYVDGVFVTSSPAGLSRPDVAAAFPSAGDRHGFVLTLPTALGRHSVCVYAINVGQGGTNPGLGCRDVTVGLPPTGRIDAVTVAGFQARVLGWALDPDTAGPIDVRLFIDGQLATTVRADGDRPDIAAAFPGATAAHGIDTTLTLGAGRHTICGQAVNVLGGSGDTSISCGAVEVWGSRHEPTGQLDAAVQSSGITMVTGWALDPDVPTAAIPVHFYVDGRYANVLTAGEARPDVAAAFPGAGATHGYTGYFILPPGGHTICVYAINQGAGGLHPQLGCRPVTVP